MSKLSVCTNATTVRLTIEIIAIDITKHRVIHFTHSIYLSAMMQHCPIRPKQEDLRIFRSSLRTGISCIFSFSVHSKRISMISPLDHCMTIWATHQPEAKRLSVGRAGHLGFAVLWCSYKSYFQVNLTINSISWPGPLKEDYPLS